MEYPASWECLKVLKATVHNQSSFLFPVGAHICDLVSIRSHLTSRSRLSSNLLALFPITLGAMSDF